MRKLSFVNYLLVYLSGISGVYTSNIHKLVKLMNNNYRMRDALILYAALSNKRDLFNKYTSNKYKDLINLISTYGSFSDVFSEYEFKKIYSSYLSYTKRFYTGDKIKERARQSIMTIMNEKNISKYRIYKDLKLNPGNINAFLKNNDSKKVSMDNVKKIYDYVLNY